MADCTKYTTNFEIEGDKLLPDHWRFSINTGAFKVEFVNWYFTFFSSLRLPNEELVRFCEFIGKFTDYTGQKLALEEFLNDFLDPVQRRIFIDLLDVFYTEGIAVAINNEDNPFLQWEVQKNNEATSLSFSVGLNSENVVESNDDAFIVQVPNALFVTDEAINELLKIYVPAAVTWRIERF